MVGYFTRMLDDKSLVRGVTYTILPDGESMRVPVMNRREVRAAAQMHTGDEDHDAMQALKDILAGKKPMKGRAYFDKRGRTSGGRTTSRQLQMGGRREQRRDAHHSWEGMQDYIRPTSLVNVDRPEGIRGAFRSDDGSFNAGQRSGGSLIPNRPGVEQAILGQDVEI